MAHREESIGRRVWRCVCRALPKAARTCLWLLEIILPVSLAVRLLQYSGLLGAVSGCLAPAFGLIGLPGEAAIVFLTSIFTPLYAPIALITSMPLTVRQLTILSLMCLLSHSLPVECAVQSRTGSTFFGMFALRVTMSFVMAFTVHHLMPHGAFDMPTGLTGSVAVSHTLGDVVVLWLLSSLRIALLFAAIVPALMILHYVLDEFDLLRGLSRRMAPVMDFFGLPRECSFLWLVGNIVGLSYGSAIMMEQLKQDAIARRSCDLLNHHLAVSHSLLEDTIIFAALGAPWLWIILPRLAYAFVVVRLKLLVERIRVSSSCRLK